MKRIFLTAAAAVLLSTAAYADPFSGAYGNTVTTTLPDGSKVVSYVNQDGTWERHTPDGKVTKGTFTWKDATTACFTVTDPPPTDPSKASGCQQFQGTHNVGDTWTDTGPDGKTVSTTITAGH